MSGPAAAAEADLLAMAREELERALDLDWRALAKIVPWGDSFEGVSPGGRDVLVERAYLWRAGPEGDILCEVEVADLAASGLAPARLEAVIACPAAVGAGGRTK